MNIFYDKIRSFTDLYVDAKSALSFGLIIILMGCQSVGRPLGWAKLDVRALSQTVPDCSPLQGQALICRDNENAFDFSISPIKSANLLESWTKDQYEILMVFTTLEFPPASSELLVPLFHFDGFSKPEIIFDSKTPRVFVSLLANSLALDLFGAALMAPSGLSGALINPGSGSVYQLEAKLSRPGDAVAKVWLSKNERSILIESRVEYSTLWSISFLSNTFANFELRAGEAKWVHLCNECHPHFSNIQYTVFALPSTPQLSNWIKHH